MQLVTRAETVKEQDNDCSRFQHVIVRIIVSVKQRQVATCMDA